MQKILSFFVPVLFFIGNKVPLVKTLAAYIGSALVLIYLGSALGAYIAGSLFKSSSGGYLSSGIGFFTGLVFGIIGSIWLGKFIMANDWAYAVVGLLCWILLFWFRPLV